MKYFAGLAVGAAFLCLAGSAALPAQANPAMASVPPPNAEDFDTGWSAFQLYRDGKYTEAMKAGASENSARGYALASAAAIGDAAEHIPPCLSCVKRAEDYARKAVAADPSLALGHVFLAMSLGLDAHIIGSVSALSKGYASLSKKEIEAALKLAPKNARALAAMGGWNLEVVRGAGSMIASWQYGASTDKGIEYFNKAIAIDPGNVVVHYQYALAMAGLDADEYHDQIEKQLTEAANGTPKTAYDKMSKERAAKLLEILKSGKSDLFDKTVSQYQGYPS